MKIFKKKEEKLKVGRPKLADTELKKTSYIMLGISALLIMILLSGTLVSLNILPKFGKIKGELCSEIPARFRPYNAETNPEGLHDYGFTNNTFYSIVKMRSTAINNSCNDVTEEDLLTITSIDQSGCKCITNTDGIQYLTNLTHIGGSDLFSIETIDFSYNKKLTELEIRGGGLQNIDLSKNTELKIIDLRRNSISNIDVSKNTLLTSLDLDDNKISNIDVSKNTLLTSLSLENNNVGNIDISNNTALTILNLSGNSISNIDISNNKLIKYLHLSNINLDGLNVNEHTALETLNLSNNNISSVDVSKNTLLTTLDLSNNNISSVDVSKNTLLTTLDLSNNNLTTLNIKNNTKLNMSNLKVTGNSFPETYLLAKYYDVDNENKIIDLQNDVLSTAIFKNLYSPSGFSFTLNDDKLEMKSNNIIKETFTIVNYKNYELSSSYYTIDQENKIINLNANVMDSINNRFYYDEKYNSFYSLKAAFKVNPGNYTIALSEDKLQIKNGSDILDEYTLTNYEKYRLNVYYPVDKKAKTIDLAECSYRLDPDTGRFYYNDYSYITLNTMFKLFPSSYTEVIKDGKLQIKNGSELLDEYTLLNYRLFSLTSSYYTINNITKTIDLAGSVIDSVNNRFYYDNSNYYTLSSAFRLYPYSYSLVMSENKLQIKKGNEVTDEYSLTNYKLYGLTTNRDYIIDIDNKTIDVKGEPIDSSLSNEFIIVPNNYRKNVVGKTLEIRDNNNNLIDTLNLINDGIYSIKSTKYDIDYNSKTINVKGDAFSIINSNDNWSISNNLTLKPYNYRKEFSNDKLIIKNANNEEVTRYTIINYSLYSIDVNTNYYTIDKENKIIDARGNKYSTNYIYLTNPNNFEVDAHDDLYVLKNQDGNIIDTYIITNQEKYNFDPEVELGIGREFYTKCVQRDKYSGAVNPYPMTKDEIEEIASLSCYEKNLSDTTGIDKLINLEELDLEGNNIESINISKNTKIVELNLAYNKLNNITGLDKLTNLYGIALNNNNLSGELDLSNYESLIYIYLSNNKFSIIKLPKNKDIEYIDLRNNKLQNINLSYYDNLYELYLDNNELESIILPESEDLRRIYARNNKLTSLDVSNNPNIEELYLDHNKLSKIDGLENLEELYVLVVHDNNFSSLDLSHNTNLNAVLLQKNPLYKGIYMLPGTELEYNKYVRFYNAVTYDMGENEYVKYEDGKIKALKEGTSTIYMYVDNMMTMDNTAFDHMMYCQNLYDEDYDRYQDECNNGDEDNGEQTYIIANKIVVYDISSDTYVIDKDNKTIDANKQDIDVSKINISEGLTLKVDGTNLLVMDGEDIAVVYKILNPKEEVKPSIKVTKAKVVNKDTTDDGDKKEELVEDKDIYLEGRHVSVFALKEIKGTDRNIVVKDGIFTFTINGKDINNVTGDLDLKVTMNNLTNSELNNQIKERVNDGLVLDFNSDKELPGRVKVEVNVPNEMLEMIDKNINVYRYKENIFNLIAEDLKVRDKKVSFYIDKLGYYVLTSDKVKEGVYDDTTLIEMNKVLNKEEVKKHNTKLIICVCITLAILVGVGVYFGIKNKDMISRKLKSIKKPKKKSNKKKKKK